MSNTKPNGDERFWLPAPGETPVPVGLDHPEAVSLAEAAARSGVDPAILRRLWARVLGRHVGTPAPEASAWVSTPEGSPAGSAGPSEAEFAAEAFRALEYPWLSAELWERFRELCDELRVNWRAREGYPRTTRGSRGTELVMVVVGLELLRRRAHATGAYAGLTLTPQYDEDGLVSAVTAEALRVVGGVERRFRQAARWDEVYGWWAGAAPRAGVLPPGVELTDEQRRGPYAPDLDVPLCMLKPTTCLERVAEGMALRAAFPEVCGGLYVPEELPGKPSRGSGGAARRAGRFTGPTRGGGVFDGQGEAPVSLVELKRELLRRDDWDHARWETELAKARGEGGDERAVCRRIWGRA